MFIENKDFQAGHVAYFKGLSKQHNPYTFTGTPRLLWDCGWDTANLLDNEERLNQSLDLQYVPAIPYEQGRNAFKNGIAIGDCPYGADYNEETTHARRDWINGYINAETNAGSKWNLSATVGFCLLASLILWAIAWLFVHHG